MKNLTFILTFTLGTIVFGQAYPTRLTVAQDSSGDFTSIQAAIDATKAFPDVPIQIFIKAGTYREKVVVYEWNTHLSLIGDSTAQTIISYDDHFSKIDRGRNSTFHTYTLKVEANDFYGKYLTIENTAGDIGQAVALHVAADRVQFQHCSISGNQDTMYLTGENNRNYFQQCIISGTTDFIFGAATAVFESCEIVSKKASYITAASTLQNVEYGFVFKNCKLIADNVPHKSTYLGRPWRGYAKTVFIECFMDSHIHPEGWKQWHQRGRVFYAEYGSIGSGSNSANRVIWSNQLSKKEVKNYSIEMIFGEWNPLKK